MNTTESGCSQEVKLPGVRKARFQTSAVSDKESTASPTMIETEVAQQEPTQQETESVIQPSSDGKDANDNVNRQDEYTDAVQTGGRADVPSTAYELSVKLNRNVDIDKVAVVQFQDGVLSMRLPFQTRRETHLVPIA